jgi:hypothetical protein
MLRDECGDFAAPGGTVKSFQTIIARKPRTPG